MSFARGIISYLIAFADETKLGGLTNGLESTKVASMLASNVLS